MPDYIFMLESRLTPEQLETLNRVQREAQDLALNLYLVGGAVRDLMAGSNIRDLDFASEGNPARLLRRVQAGGVRRVEFDEVRNRAEVVLANGVSLSLEMARTEVYREPGKRPEVRPAPIMEDLRRRDFSINAMGISLTPGSRGLLLDPTNGQADIEHRQLRILHNYSFLHDPVRLLRLVRFESRLGFKPEPRTQELFEAGLERGYQDYIDEEALGREAEQIASEENIVAVLKALAGHELLGVFQPLLQRRVPDYDGLAKLQKYRQQAVEAGYRLDSFGSAMHYIRRRLPGRAQKQLLRNLALSKPRLQALLGLEGEARRLAQQLGRQRNLGPRPIYHMLEKVSVDLLVFILAEYSHKQKVQAKVYNYLFKYKPLRKRLPVRELQLMGVPPGPKSDEILEKYFEAVLDGKLRGRTQQLKFLRNLAGVPKAKPAPPPKPKKGAKKAEEAPAAPAPTPPEPAATREAKPLAAPERVEKKSAPAKTEAGKPPAKPPASPPPKKPAAKRTQATKPKKAASPKKSKPKKSNPKRSAKKRRR
jgi:tRNA nucleotidyltransferase/poly(A) polymerase